MTLETYLAIREGVFAAGYRPEYDWAQNIKPPATPVELFCEYAWVVVNSGMREQIARKIWERVQDAIAKGLPVSSVFRHPGKAAALEEAWRHKHERFELLRQARLREMIVEWCASLPWIGDITKYHLAKNLGNQVAKPDRWLVRVAAESGETVQGLCERLATESGDKVVTVDSVIWRACNLGIWRKEQTTMELS